MSVHLVRTLVLLYINTLNGEVILKRPAVTIIYKFCLFSCVGVWSDSVSGHLERGKKLLQDGNLPEALEQYNLAVGMLLINNNQ